MLWCINMKCQFQISQHSFCKYCNKPVLLQESYKRQYDPHRDLILLSSRQRLHEETESIDTKVKIHRITGNFFNNLKTTLKKYTKEKAFLKANGDHTKCSLLIYKKDTCIFFFFK